MSSVKKVRYRKSPPIMTVKSSGGARTGRIIWAAITAFVFPIVFAVIAGLLFLIPIIGPILGLVFAFFTITSIVDRVKHFVKQIIIAFRQRATLTETGIVGRDNEGKKIKVAFGNIACVGLTSSNNLKITTNLRKGIFKRKDKIFIVDEPKEGNLFVKKYHEIAGAKPVVEAEAETEAAENA